ncbi:MBL fold metallo-hydrolase [Defluviitalea phaphyphila]|uniref:MBL fold metallo-hydrolase n=1 Tax=Defluviitalea phaphyphila TaxID=1473580 RepID=UPI0007318CBD|nr:MBL fold metallo-hydrolase [Defluviitalea phaphyphila]
MGFKLCTIASGSSGNCVYIGSPKVNLLVDAGISGKRIQNGLEIINVNPKNIDGILITHEHIDHIKGAGILSRRFDIPLIANKNTWEAIDEMERGIGKINPNNRIVIEKEKDLIFKDLIIYSYSIPHDAADPVGYTFICQNKKISIATDLGHINSHIKNNIRESNLILLEANHDIDMLKTGSYPYYLKRRILGKNGHLCNEMAGKVLVDVFHKDLKAVILGHLSKENNYPDLAYMSVRNELISSGIEVDDKIELTVASRDEISKIFEI